MDWLPYPENTPCDGEYLVTLKGGHVCVLKFNNNFKQYDENDLKFYGPAWPDEEMGGVYKNVIAFMKKPQPYQIS